MRAVITPVHATTGPVRLYIYIDIYILVPFGGATGGQYIDTFGAKYLFNIYIQFIYIYVLIILAVADGQYIDTFGATLLFVCPHTSI